MIREILRMGDPRLLQVAAPVYAFNTPELQALLADMFDTMAADPEFQQKADVRDAKLKQRLEEIATASVDHVFGRNPRLSAAPDRPEKGFPEIERGWPKHHPENVCARLELCRGNIASLPGSEMYPFNPSDAYRHAEGWVNYGASWCISLAYLKFDAVAKITPSPVK